MNAVGGFAAAVYETAVDEGFAQIAAEWQALSLAVGRPSCFAAPAYFQAWRETLADDVSPFLLTARRAGRLAGVMPMMRARVRRGPLCAPRHDFAPSDRVLLGADRARPFAVRQLSPVVSMPASWVAPAPLCHDLDRVGVTQAMARHIAGLTGWDSFALPVDAGADQEMWLAALDGVGLRPWVHHLGRQIGAIGVVEPFAAKVARQNKKFRQNIRRAEAAAGRAGLTIAVYEGNAVIAHLPALAAVGLQSWKQTGRGDGLTVPYAGRQQGFLEHLVTLAAEGMPVLTVASCDGAPVAVLLSLLHGDRLTALVIFRNDAVPDASPGMLVLGRMIDWTHARGLAGFDLNATHEWTRHLIDEVRHQNIVVAFAPTWRGRGLGVVSALARRWR
jgi:CelD/BcsL family acetyltransferase involved in cellulose biosynthesis